MLKRLKIVIAGLVRVMTISNIRLLGDVLANFDHDFLDFVVLIY